MGHLQKLGGIAALVEAVAYIAGFALFIFFLDASAYVGPARKAAFLVENRSALYAAITLVYLVTGIALVALASALHERLKPHSPTLMLIATPVGFIWAGLILASGMISLVGMQAVVDLHVREPERAAALWLAVATVADGLGGGIEIVGGLWVLLVSLAALDGRALPRTLAYLGLLVGGAGILTVAPALDGAVEVFGLAMILWFAALGIVMLRPARAELRQTPADRPA